MSRFPAGATIPASIVAALKAVSGGLPKARAHFVKGQCVRGTYAASDQAKEITKSRSFTRPSRVLARFSIDGNPGVPDADSLALLGFSFRLGEADHRSDFLLESAPVHFAKTLDQMLAFLEARIPRADGKPNIRKLRAFSAANPETLHQADYLAAHPPPAGFAGTTYWGVHCFPARNAKGETRFIKFKVVPVGGDAGPARNRAEPTSADALHDNLKSRIITGDVRFNVMALLDRPGDPVMDVTIRWPDEDRREAVRLGTIVITGLEADETCDALGFDPVNLAEGIGPPPDEIFAARRIAYAVSPAKRR